MTGSMQVFRLKLRRQKLVIVVAMGVAVGETMVTKDVTVKMVTIMLVTL